MKVCEKVEQKGKTTYNEVADELVNEFAVSTTECKLHGEVTLRCARRSRGRSAATSCAIATSCTWISSVVIICLRGKLW